MASRIYPTQAPHEGSTTLTGGGSANDIFTFPAPYTGTPVVQNNTGAAIYVAAGGAGSAPTAATPGDEAVLPGQEFYSDEQAAWVAIYGAAGTHVNGTSTGGLDVYAK